MKNNVFNLIALTVTIVITAIALSIMPDSVPVHFDFGGTVDRWGSKYELLVMPLCMLAMFLFWVVINHSLEKKIATSTDEKEIAELKANMSVMNVTSVTVSVVFSIVNLICIYMSYSNLDKADIPVVDINKLLCIIMGASFVLLGNFMPKSKNNPYLGFRLPWTRYNDVTWSKSNRMAGIAFVIEGIITIITGVLLSGVLAMIVFSVSVSILLLIVIVYAYFIYKEEVSKGKNEN